MLPAVKTLAVRWLAARVRSVAARPVEFCVEALVLLPALAARAEALALVDELLLTPDGTGLTGSSEQRAKDGAG